MTAENRTKTSLSAEAGGHLTEILQLTCTQASDIGLLPTSFFLTKREMAYPNCAVAVQASGLSLLNVLLEDVHFACAKSDCRSLRRRPECFELFCVLQVGAMGDHLPLRSIKAKHIAE